MHQDLSNDPTVGIPAVALGRMHAELENAITWTRVVKLWPRESESDVANICYIFEEHIRR